MPHGHSVSYPGWRECPLSLQGKQSCSPQDKWVLPPRAILPQRLQKKKIYGLGFPCFGNNYLATLPIAEKGAGAWDSAAAGFLLMACGFPVSPSLHNAYLDHSGGAISPSLSPLCLCHPVHKVPPPLLSDCHKPMTLQT